MGTRAAHDLFGGGSVQHVGSAGPDRLGVVARRSANPRTPLTFCRTVAATPDAPLSCATSNKQSSSDKSVVASQPYVTRAQRGVTSRLRAAPTAGLPLTLGYNPAMPFHAASDVALDMDRLARLAQRDAAALSELYDAHSRLLFGVICRIVGDRTEAEEVLQDAFVQAWTRAGTYNAGLGSPVGWLVGIARHRAIDRLRANAV